MAILTKEDFFKKFHIQAADCEIDNDGQLVLYTGVYDWPSDDNLHDEPEPDPIGDEEEDDGALLDCGCDPYDDACLHPQHNHIGKVAIYPCPVCNEYGPK